jgi:hypothetical protein
LYALGRLFGLANDGFTVNSQSFQGLSSIDQGLLTSIATAIQSARTNPNNETYFIAQGAYAFIDPNTVAGGLGGLGLPSPSVPGLGGSSNGPNYATQFHCNADVFKMTVMGVDPNNPLALVGTVALRDDPDFLAANSAKLADMNAQYNSSQVGNEKYVGGTYSFPINALRATDTTKNTLVSQLATLSSIDANNTNFSTEVSTFLNTSGAQANAIAKSFEDTGGKGLAGFIETMNFDFFDKVTWEISTGRIAPKICKVTIGFAPVHDISPGIDSLGFNRAPVYPIGIMGQQT